ncbi:hypothetical protein B0H63DRAFT_488752 [Podospora didyma]|uniref:F-box domain-containing protein n=1 Tax=Podospora didyma TaxID=330526 RepID=A0AAE0K1W5_9PEZI|nr:hypothetical protein B0H63DRAFT_488752 [Podospora didyma]
MGPPNLLSLPTEILTLVLEECDDLHDIFAVITSCKRIYAVFVANSGPIVWKFGLRNLYAFDLALIAVRATKIVADAYQADRLPPRDRLFPIQQMSGQSRRPSLAELNDILNIQHFGRCIEHMMLIKANQLGLHLTRNVGQDLTILEAAVGWRRRDPQFPHVCHLWRESLHRTIYRLIVAGAVLSPAYHEPFLHKAKPANLLITHIRNSTSNLQSDGMWIIPSDLAYLRHFPLFRVYKQFMPYDKDEESTFRPLADWLVDDMVSAAEKEGSTFDLYGERMGPWPIVRQIMQAVHVHEDLNNLIASGLNDGGRGSIPRPYCPPNPRMTGPPPLSRTRTVTVILHGIWKPEVITMPSRPGDEITLPALPGPAYIRTHLVARPALQATGAEAWYGSHKFLNFAKLLKDLSEWSFSGNSQKWWLDPEHRLFVYMLRAYGGIEQVEEFFEAYRLPWSSLLSVLAFRSSPGLDVEIPAVCEDYPPNERTRYVDVIR